MPSLLKLLQKQKNPEKYKNAVFLSKLQKIAPLAVTAGSKDAYHFKHSGNVGDIIYAIPAMLAIANGKPIHLHLHINQKGHYGKNKHPLGNVMLNEKSVLFLQPLILEQPGFVTCDVYSNQEIDADFDAFRSYPFMQDRGNISRWYFLVFGVHYCLENAWLQAPANKELSNHIVVCRSQRYHAPGIDYSFLNQYPTITFIGMPDEYQVMKQRIPNIMYRPVKDFLEMAQLIACCKLFIGNQSFPYSLAEAMKTPRLLEWYFQTPNVNVAGKDGYDFCLQHHFENLVATRMAV